MGTDPLSTAPPPAAHPAPAPGIVRVLMVCTANQCRSAMAAVIAQRATQALGLPIVTESAGTLAVEGAEATAKAVKAARSVGLDLSGHRSRPLTPTLLERADLTLTMEPFQARKAILELGGSRSRVWPLLEMASVCRLIRPLHGGETFDDWLERAVAAKGPPDPTDRMYTVSDPTGRSTKLHRATIAELTDAIEGIVGSLRAAAG
ncbi:MAG: hypothetical protein R2698_05765 [Microthrixaceae bacterium]